jgi:DNA-binding NtrC family response regulator
VLGALNKTIRILIVDDEPSVGDGLRLVLEAKGYEVVLVTNGLDAIAQARNSRFAFGVVDLYLTDITGFEVIKDIHTLQPETPMLLITAHGSPTVFDEAMKFGAVGALAKPFHPSEILKLIDSHLVDPATDSA